MIDAPANSIDLVRTRVTLAHLQANQERLHARLEATGLTSFVDRSEWLAANRTPDEALAERRKWARLGVSDPVEFDLARFIPAPPVHAPAGERLLAEIVTASRGRHWASRSAPKRHRKPYEPTPAQLRIAIAVLEKKEHHA